jgi:hypothetical protein
MDQNLAYRQEAIEGRGPSENENDKCKLGRDGIKWQ